MAMKLKAGADLCDMQILNFCIHNAQNDKSAAPVGYKYLNTLSSNTNAYLRERIYVGGNATTDGWRTAAYLDDLDKVNIANNTDFLALKEKVDAFLDGDVDSDAVLENLKEIQAFLDNYSSATDLSDILATKADNGTVAAIDNRLKAAESHIATLQGTLSTEQGNIDSLQSYFSSGIANKAAADALGNVIASTYATKEELNAKYSFDRIYAGVVTADVIDAENLCGELDGNAATATKLATARTIWGQSFDGTGNVSGALNGVSQLNFSASKSFYLNSQGHFIPNDKTSTDYWWGIQRHDGNYGIVVVASTGKFQARYGADLAFGGGYVGIGTTSPTEKLHVVGNLYVTGNIIADGEISGGGSADESTTASGGANIKTDTIATGLSSKTITHNLETEDVVICIYEKNNITSKWDMILTDVRIVDANNITVTFGSATTVEHKVVIIGE